MKNLIREKKNELAGSQECKNFKEEMKRIYKSKISDIPTPGYAGFESAFTSPVSYLNKNKILFEIEEKENKEKLKKKENEDNETIAGFYYKKTDYEKEDLDEVNFFIYF